ncbi:MAG: hypothetical protein LBJ44_11370 [Propionibacteriaceae bacterium]|jgi:hypothetical protein|nr:hypothetical protein [Propionibacteriaceae bacterium]
MRTTVDLPPALHHRVKDYATQSGQSMSATLAALVAKAMSPLADETPPTRDPRSGFPVVSYGQPITAVAAARLMDEEP